jgi:pyridoxal phosphate enzyme (YggS family)
VFSIKENLAEIEGAISAACQRAGRDRGTVKLLAVSKTQPDALIEEAYALGVRDFGENYVQELVGRRERLAHLKDARWHLIGPLQSNKVKIALECADVFHALDSESVLKVVQKRVGPEGKPWPVFVQVNIDGEPSKSGLLPAEVPAFIEKVRAARELQLRGLMAIPEPHANIEAMGPAFRALKELATRTLGPSAQLSMGMSEDFPVAIAEGAHWVRVGRRLFGARR